MAALSHQRHSIAGLNQRRRIFALQSARLAVALFRSIRKRAFVPGFGVVPRGMKQGAPSFRRVIQWISQLCIYHYDSIHLDGSPSLSLFLFPSLPLSLNDHGHTYRKYTHTRARTHVHMYREEQRRKVGRKEESLIRVATVYDGVG